MRSYSQKRKNNIIIGSLCAVMLLMVVGYAAFNSVLNINGTANLTSNWDIEIVAVEIGEEYGSASVASEPTWDKLNAEFHTNLVSPGDFVEYGVIIANNGDLNAVLNRIKLSDTNNPAIKFTVSSQNLASGESLNEGDILAAGEQGVLIVKVEYDSSVTSQPSSTDSSLSVKLDFGQEGVEYVPSIDTDNYTGVVYSFNNLTPNDDLTEEDYLNSVVFNGDSLEKIKGYTEDYNTLGSNIFIKHNIANGLVVSSEACFIKDNKLYCLKTNEYETNKVTLSNLFTECYEHYDDSHFDCMGQGVRSSIANSGGVQAVVDPDNWCNVRNDGGAFCRNSEVPDPVD